MLIFGGILFIIIGFVNIFQPSFAWYLKEGWKVDGNSEPSDSYLFLTKIGGFVAIICGLLILLIGLFT